jgi:hypothetical protein
LLMSAFHSPPWLKLISAGRDQRSFSASSRNSSGTERESPSADPYLTASHPKQFRILSMARSAVQRARNPSLGARPALLVFKATREFQLHVPLTLEVPHEVPTVK